MTPLRQKAVLLAVAGFLFAASIALAFFLTRIPPLIRYPLAVTDFIMALVVFVAYRQRK